MVLVAVMSVARYSCCSIMTVPVESAAGDSPNRLPWLTMTTMGISPQTQAFIDAHRTEDVRDLALRAKKSEGLDLPFALDQIAGWQTARHKLPEWAGCDGIVYPPHLSMEQCSSQFTARYKASVARRLTAPVSEHADREPPRSGTLVDLTGGFGVDCSYMSREFSHAVYVERQEHLCVLAVHNMNALGLRHVAVVNADAEEYLRALTGESGDRRPESHQDHSDHLHCPDPNARQAQELRQDRESSWIGGSHRQESESADSRSTVVPTIPAAAAAATPVSLIFLDPARRDEHGARTYAIEDCTPNVLELRDRLLAAAPCVMIKLSPMLDWRKAVADFGGAVSEVHIVSTGNECKELLLVLQRHESGAGDTGTADAAGSTGAYTSTAAGNAAPDNLAPGNPAVIAAAAMHGPSPDIAPASDGTPGNPDPPLTLRVYCVNDGDVVSYDYDPNGASSDRSLRLAPLPEPMAYLYEPNASIMKAGCFALVERRYGVVQIGPDSHLFVGARRIDDFPGRAFAIDTVTAMGKRERKTALAGITRANISVRNFPLTAPQLRAKLKLADGGDVYLFGTTMQGGRHVLIRAAKVRAEASTDR